MDTILVVERENGERVSVPASAFGQIATGIKDALLLFGDDYRIELHQPERETHQSVADVEQLEL